MNSESLDRPIPIILPGVDGWKTVPLQLNRQKLVPLGPFSNYPEISTNSIYFGESFNSPYPTDSLQGSLLTMFVREDVADQLVTAQSLLPRNLRLVVYDAYRTLDVQQSLFDAYLSPLKDLHPDWDEQRLLTETQKYVSIPSHDFTRPSPHNTGGSVDLIIFELPDEAGESLGQIETQLKQLSPHNWQDTYLLEMRRSQIIKKFGRTVEFGTLFDHGGEKAGLNYFELQSQQRYLSETETEALKNRRMLYNVMIQSGLEPYADEWWHYNSKLSQMGAKTAGLEVAEYGAVQLSPENIQHELMRKNHFLGTIHLASVARGTVFTNKFRRTNPVLDIAHQAAFNWREIQLANAEVISPTI